MVSPPLRPKALRMRTCPNSSKDESAANLVEDRLQGFALLSGGSALAPAFQILKPFVAADLCRRQFRHFINDDLSRVCGDTVAPSRTGVWQERRWQMQGACGIGFEDRAHVGSMACEARMVNIRPNREEITSARGL